MLFFAPEDLRFFAKRSLSLWFATCVLLWTKVAAGHAFSTLDRLSGGEGIVIGPKSRLHAGADVQAGVDSNIQYNANRSGERPGVVGLVVPEAVVALANQTLEERALKQQENSAQSPVDYYLGAWTSGRIVAHEQRQLRALSVWGVGFLGRVSLWPGRKFGLMLDEDLQRTAQPQAYEANGRFNQNRIIHSTRLALLTEPMRERLRMGLGYGHQLMYFENAAQAGQKSSRLGHNLFAQIAVRPAAKLWLSLDYTMALADYSVFDRKSKPWNNTGHRLTLGVQAPLSAKLLLHAAVGWGYGRYLRQNNFNSVIARGGLRFMPLPATRIEVNGFREFQDALLGNFFVDSGAQVLVRHQAGPRMNFQVSLAAVHRRYEGLPVPQLEQLDVAGYGGLTKNGGRADIVIAGELSLDYAVHRLVVLSVSYGVAVDKTTFSTLFLRPPGGSISDPLPRDFGEFMKHTALAGLGLRF